MKRDFFGRVTSRCEELPSGIRIPRNPTEPYRVKNSLNFKKADIDAAKEFYTKDYHTWPKHLARRAMKNIRWFDLLWEYQEGHSYEDLAWRYKTTAHTIKDKIKRSKQRVENFLKIKEIEEKNASN